MYYNVLVAYNINSFTDILHYLLLIFKLPVALIRHSLLHPILIYNLPSFNHQIHEIQPTIENMASAAASLLGRQLKEIQKARDLPGISCGLVKDNIFEWEVMLMLSDECKYYGGMFLSYLPAPSYISLQLGEYMLIIHRR